MSPYEAVHGRKPPKLLDYLAGTSPVESVDHLLSNPASILSTLRANLLRAQTRMQNQANAGRTDVTFSLNNSGFLKLQPYHQSTLAHRQSHKLCRQFYGPFHVWEKIGVALYHLDLHLSARIHNVFHVSHLKKCMGDPSDQQCPLSATFINNQLVFQPTAILRSSTLLQHG